MHYIEKSNTPFKVTQTTFSDLRNMDENALKSMKESLLKRVDISALRCWYMDEKLIMGTCAGFNMFSIDQGNPSLVSDKEEQTWYISTWGMNMYKNEMTPL